MRMKEEREKEVIVLRHLVSNICTSIWIWRKYNIAYIFHLTYCKEKDASVHNIEISESFLFYSFYSENFLFHILYQRYVRNERQLCIGYCLFHSFYSFSIKTKIMKYTLIFFWITLRLSELW